MIPVPASEGLLFGSFLFRQDLYTSDFFLDFWQDQFGSSLGLLPKENPLIKYYSHEMGENLSRIFLIGLNSLNRKMLLEVKLRSLVWENQWRISDKRMVNVDIGFISPENFILATTKNYSHRIYVGDEIFADLTYLFQKFSVMTLPWTYPDYLDDQKKDFILFARNYLVQHLNNEVL
jgi:Domain of unknown function (DUF4416)